MIFVTRRLSQLQLRVLWSAVLLVSAAGMTVRVKTGAPQVTHRLSNLTMGCHSDSGFGHQVRGFYAQMVIDESFEADHFEDGIWHDLIGPGVLGNISSDVVHSFHGVASKKLAINHMSAPGRLGVSNRGMANAGLYLQQDKQYEGFLFAKLGDDCSSLVLTVSLEGARGQTLAAQHLMLQSHEWTRLNFTLTPQESTTCQEIQPEDDPSVHCGGNITTSGHICVQCHGQITVSIAAAGSVYLDYIYMQPGQWGRLPGLPVLSSGADLLTQMGVSLIRQGGSFAGAQVDHGPPADYYQWQRWTGPAYARPSRGSVWQTSLIGGWGPFEMIDMCMQLGVEPVVAISDTSSPESMADLVEYCWGNSSTTFGSKRVADGHPDPYRVRYFELGNEQYNAQYIPQVVAMERRARSLGLTNNSLYYVFPGVHSFLDQTDLARVAQLYPRLDSQMIADLHEGTGGGVEDAEALFGATPGVGMGVGIGEVNAGKHDQQRALDEAADLNDWFNAGGAVQARAKYRSASFCMESASDYDAFDQGLAFFLPNMTWLQPPGYVHQMISQTWEFNALPVTVDPEPTQPPWVHNTTASAQQSDDGRTVVVRLVNYNASRANVTVVLESQSTRDARSVQQAMPGVFQSAAATPRLDTHSGPRTSEMWVLHADMLTDANTAGAPRKISPKKSNIIFQSGDWLDLPPYSYTVLRMPVLVDI